MIRQIFLLVTILCQLAVYGQSVQRSQSNLPILSESKAVIENPLGWVLQDNGLWESAKGKILLYDSEANRNPDPLEKLGRHNISRAEIKEVLLEDEQYVVLIIFYTGGYFEFPDLRQGFKKTKNARYYVFNAQKLDDILPLKSNFNDPYAVNLEVFAYDDLVNFDKKELNTKISYNILRTKELEEVSQFTAVLNLMPVITNGKKYYRFRTVKLLNKKSIYQKYLLDENKDKLFTRSYYEVPYKEFVDFFGSIEVIKHDFNVDQPENFVEFYKRGVMRYNRGHYSNALADFNSAIKLEPENRFMMLYAYLGSTQHELENYPAAIRAFDKAIIFEPKDPSQKPAWIRTFYNRGVSKYYMENKIDACKDMNKAKKIGLKDEDALKRIDKLCKGKLKNVMAQ
jgi:tetratricopeptide (TPR) repeat protein